MTSGTGISGIVGPDLIESRATASQTFGVPTAAFLASLLVSQYSVAVVAAIERDVRSSTQLTCSITTGLFDELLDFHKKLADSQQALPEDAAKVLRENLWNLYA